jgi:hypothetical protein
MVDTGWELRHGHAVASARYGAMTWASPAPRPDEEGPTDPRERAKWLSRKERSEKVKRDRWQIERAGRAWW